MRTIVALLLVAAGCYSGARAARDTNRAWQGRTLAELEASWGQPAARTSDGDSTVVVWTHQRTHTDLPSVRADVDLDERGFDFYGEIRRGAVRHSSTEVAARIDAQGVVQSVSGPSLRWGPPNDANIHWGALLGMHVGMGRLDDTGTPLPSGGLYIGGMLARTVGLVGTFSLVSGKDEAGGAMAFAWGLAPQWWPATRLSLRAGPAMVLAFDPGFESPGLEPGVDACASYALVKSGSFALDLRLDLVAGTTTRFGSIGVGVNMN